MTKKTITVAYGDGIGPEIMKSVIQIMEAAQIPLKYDVIEIGEKVYLSGNTSGINNEAWNTILKNKIFLKAPITTPQGGGMKSLNVTMRKMLSLYANIRPCVSYEPFVKTKHPKMDLVIVRENEEDLYGGIEYRISQEVFECLKLISKPGCERIIRYAFEYAVAHNRKKVSCFSKDNIMKMTDGLFHQTFNEIAKQYPQIQSDHYIIDIGTARLADTPQIFDVIVTENLYGDIISDVAAQITGSVGLAGSSNIGLNCAMFEAIHGSAPDIAGKGLANPSGLLQAAVLMLTHMGFGEDACKIQNAWLKAIEDGIHTADIYQEGLSKKRVSTEQFTQAIIERLGQAPSKFACALFKADQHKKLQEYVRSAPESKELVGCDLVIEFSGKDANKLAEEINQLCKGSEWELKTISNRGVKVWPNPFGDTFVTDCWQARMLLKTKINCESDRHYYQKIIQLISKVQSQSFSIVQTHNLYQFKGKAGYSLGQGE